MRPAELEGEKENAAVSSCGAQRSFTIPAASGKSSTKEPEAQKLRGATRPKFWILGDAEKIRDEAIKNYNRVKKLVAAVDWNIQSGGPVLEAAKASLAASEKALDASSEALKVLREFVAP
jgi:hypothetical protein